MRIQKRITALFVILVMLCMSIPAFAAEADTYSDTELIEYLQRSELFGRLGAFETGKDAQDVVTRAEFAHMLCGLFRLQLGEGKMPLYSDIKDEEYFEDIVCVVRNGLMVSSNDEKFYPDDPITTRDLSRGMVIALGYKKVVESQYRDKEDGYVAVAQNIKLFKGIAGKNASYAITYAEALKVFENSLSIKLMKMGFEGIDSPSYFVSDDTVLSETLKCEEKYGIVTATSLSDLYSGKDVGKGFLQIDNVTYKSNTDDPELLGYRVHYYIDEDECIIFAGKDQARNKELVADCKNIVDYDSVTRRYTFEEAVSGKKTAVIPAGSAVIYNGRANSSPSAMSFSMVPGNGTVKFIDNNMDGNYDVTVIEDYKNFVVGTVDTVNQTFYDKFDNTLKCTVDDTYKDYISISTSDGKEISFKNIKVGNVASVAQSIDGIRIKIIVSSEKVDGEIKKINEDYAVIGETEYETANDARNISAVRIGKSVSAYMDFNGKIIYIEQKNSPVEAVYLIKGSIDEDQDMLMLKFCNSSGAVETVYCDEKLYINDIRQKDHISALEMLCDPAGEPLPQILTVTRTDDGRIKRIYTVWTGDRNKCPPEALMLNSSITDSSHRYNTSSGIFLDYQTALTSNCKIFFIPPNLSDQEDFSVLSAADLKNDNRYGDSTYPFYAYVMGGEGFLCNYAVATEQLSPNRSSTYGIIKKITQVYDEDKDEACYDVEMYGGSVLRIYDNAGININNVDLFTPSVSSSTYSLTPGDLILYHYDAVDGNRLMTSASMIYDFETKDYLASNPSTKKTEDPVFYLADVWKKASGYLALSVNSKNTQYSDPKDISPSFDSSAENFRVEYLGAATIYKTDDSGKNIVGAEFADIVDYSVSNTQYSRVIIMSKLGKATICYIIK